MSNILISLAAEFTGKKAFKDADSATKKLTNNVKKLAGAVGLAYGTSAIIAYSKASVKAFVQDDNAARSLGVTLKNLGLETGNTSIYINDLISRMEKQTGVLDDELRPAMDRLLRATGSITKAQDLLGLALDISAGTGKDLTSVTQALQKAYLGNTASLSKLGVGLSKAELTASSFQAIQKKLTVLFAGQASSAAASYSGQLNKLTIASNNVKEAIGAGIVDALGTLSDDDTISNLTTNMENLAIYVADVIRGFGLMASALKNIPGISGFDVGMIPILGTYIKVLQDAGAQSRRITEVAQGKNPIQGGSYLNFTKKVTALTKEQTAAELKKLAAKKLSLAIDKANLALGKGKDLFDNEAISLNAAMINQAQQLGQTQNAAAAAMIIADMQRLKIKQDIIALEDAIASKDTARIEAATKILNADIGILGALTGQNNKVIDIKSILDSMKSTDLINLANLEAALALLAKFKFPTLGMPSSGDTTKPKNPFEGQPVLTKLTGKESIDAILEYSDAVTTLANVMADTLDAQNYADFLSLVEYQKKLGDFGGYSKTMNQGAGYGAGNVVVTIVDNTSGLIEVVQNAVIENNRNGNSTQYAGAI